MDNLAIRAAEDFAHAGYPTDAAAILLCELDGCTEEVAAQIAMAACSAVSQRRYRSAHGGGRSRAAEVLDRPQVGLPRRWPHGARITIAWTAPFRAGICREVLRGISELSAEYGLPVANVFHAGDGNLHPLILYRCQRAGELERAEELGGEDPRTVRRGRRHHHRRTRRRRAKRSTRCACSSQPRN